ncbi:MAG: Fe-S cluster assembly ATPase SufC [Alphaproteobacteria bacterium]
MIKIENLHAFIEGKEVLKGISLEIGAGEVHAIMGPNGSGKSTLSHILTGREGYIITEGSVTFEGKDLFDLSIDERARAGLFLGFQYPVEIPGVTSMNFLRTAFNAVQKERGAKELDAVSFLKLVQKKSKELSIRKELLKRAVNSGFSGGEKKRFEILQMSLLEPKLCILDEIDSGLDIDALRTVAKGINALRSPERSFLMITHYQRLLNYIEPDKIHVLADGKMIASGGKKLAHDLEEHGYALFGIEEGDKAE